MFINMTQHEPTPQQLEAGVITVDHSSVKAMLTFQGLPSAAQVRERAQALAAWAVSHGAGSAMVGGAPWLMGPLERALMAKGVTPMYAFSNRQSVEVIDPSRGW